MKSVPSFLEVDYSSHSLMLLESSLMKNDILTRADIEELKSIAKPTELVLHVLQAFCMLLQVRPHRKSLPNGSITNDYFKAF